MLESFYNNFWENLMARIQSRLRKIQTNRLRRRLVTNPVNPGSVARWIIINKPPVLSDVSNQEIVELVREYWDLIVPLLPPKLGIGEFRTVSRLASRYKRVSDINSNKFMVSLSRTNALNGLVRYAREEQQQVRWGIIWLLVGIGIGYLIWGREK